MYVLGKFTTPLTIFGIILSISILAFEGLNQIPIPYSQLSSQDLVCYLDQEICRSQVEYLVFTRQANVRVSEELANEMSWINTGSRIKNPVADL